jgi:cytochrome P450
VSDDLGAADALIGDDDPTSPYPMLAELRASGPVHDGLPHFGITEQVEGAPPQYTVYSHGLVSEVLSDHESYGSANYHELIGEVIGRTLLEMDEPEHRAYRLILQQAFSKAEMRRWEADVVRPMIEATVDRLTARTEHGAELVRDLCLPFPVRAIALLLGLPEEDHDLFQRLAFDIIVGPADTPRALAAAEELGDYFARSLAERRQDPRRDMISVLAHATADGEELSDLEVVSFLRLLLPAGAETTYRTSSSLLFALLGDPDQLELVRRDRSLLPQAVDEAVRWEPALPFVPRLVKRDVELGGRSIPAGAGLTCHLGAANHDPERFEDPDRFDLIRSVRGGLGFGFGVHTCLGMHLARMETAAVIDIVLDRLPGIRLDPDQPPPFISGAILRSPPRLHVVW